MPVERSSNVVETYSERAIVAGICGVVVFLIGLVLYIFRGDGMFVSLAILLMAGGACGFLYAVYTGLQVRKVTSFDVVCPYCETSNAMVADPSEDFACINCHRLIPIQGGKALHVSQVRCGYCNELNYFSDKTLVLLCESCNREIPISRDDGVQRHSAFAVADDDRPYDLVLIAHGHATEDLMNSLQQTLALNPLSRGWRDVCSHSSGRHW